ncbi:sensor histidine kinase [Evansella sp. AB-rgal1]|uniref:HAMP domain-containing sensor histidine kinase n=1 Tax=Evansella sp. AB-rgal1 TaxID=3242696 RepID=UPI00359D1E0B
MRRTKRRLAARFTVQFIIFFILAVVIFSGGIIAFSNFLYKEELKRNFPVGGLEGIINEATISGDGISLYSGWETLLKEKEMWLQVLDYEGQVIYSIDAPEDLPNKYNFQELIEIDKTKRFNQYKVFYAIDTYYENPYYYLLGYANHYGDLLESWVSEYSQHIQDNNEEKRNELAREVKKVDSSLKILDAYGNIVTRFGESNMENKRYGSVEIFSYHVGKGDIAKEISSYYDENSNNTWLLLSEREEGFSYDSFLRIVTITLLLAAVIILLLGIIFTAWHATSYGRPLFLFVTWLEKLGKGNYDEVLHTMNGEKIVTKKGKISGKYKLYEEVIQAFKEMAEKLKFSKEERERLDKTREAWMTGISHDLRTPLTSIQGYSHMLESNQYDWTKEELQEIGLTLREKGDYMLKLVEDFSLAFQLKNGAVPLEKEEVELGEFIQRILLLASDDVYVRKNQQIISFVVEEPIHTNIDRNLFERMLLNIIYNAIKHNPPKTKINISLTKHDDCIYLKVEDNGVGMDEETKNYLFERYYRGINTTEKTDGTGLGMNIAKGIIEVHGGEIEVESQKDVGTSIKLSFPVPS